jgi:hypothetical protein
MTPYALPHRTALDELHHLRELREERALALATPLARQPAYLDDIDAEIEASAHAYVGLAVTEMATLRAQLGGEQVG